MQTALASQTFPLPQVLFELQEGEGQREREEVVAESLRLPCVLN